MVAGAESTGANGCRYHGGADKVLGLAARVSSFCFQLVSELESWRGDDILPAAEGRLIDRKIGKGWILVCEKGS